VRWLVPWFSLLVTPAGSPMDPKYLLVSEHHRTHTSAGDKRRKAKTAANATKVVPRVNVIGGPDQALAPK
jgi:hypothetical protein